MVGVLKNSPRVIAAIAIWQSADLTDKTCGIGI
jgi:hypothetical protein